MSLECDHHDYQQQYRQEEDTPHNHAHYDGYQQHAFRGWCCTQLRTGLTSILQWTAACEGSWHVGTGATILTCHGVIAFIDVFFTVGALVPFSAVTAVGGIETEGGAGAVHAWGRGAEIDEGTTVLSSERWRTVTEIGIQPILTGGPILAGVWVTVINIHITLLPRISRGAVTCEGRVPLHTVPIGAHAGTQSRTVLNITLTRPPSPAGVTQAAKHARQIFTRTILAGRTLTLVDIHIT